jgi:hypothetical protein
VHVTDPAEHDAVIQAQTKKDPKHKFPATSRFNVFRVMNG